MKPHFKLVTISVLALLAAPSAHAFLGLGKLGRMMGFGKAAPAVAIISDIDETVRPTGHGARALAIATGHKHVSDFSGMAELYRELMIAAGSDPIKHIQFVSGAPYTLSGGIDSFLKENGYPDHSVMIRFFGLFREIEMFKTEEFRKRLAQNRGTKFFFFGDDKEKDAPAIANAVRSFPGQVAGVYIHLIEGNTPLEPGETPYYTAADVALYELAKSGPGRLNPDQVGRVAQAMLDDPTFEESVIPPYATQCPRAGWLESLATTLRLEMPPTLRDQLAKIQSRVARICVPGRVAERE